MKDKPVAANLFPPARSKGVFSQTTIDKQIEVGDLHLDPYRSTEKLRWPDHNNSRTGQNLPEPIGVESSKERRPPISSRLSTSSRMRTTSFDHSPTIKNEFVSLQINIEVLAVIILKLEVVHKCHL